MNPIIQTELYHYGVKGMKWGIRKLDKDKSGDYRLKKGTVVKRVSYSRDDPVYDNKKYVSINQDDHSKWEQYLGEAYLKRNIKTWSQTYTVKNDLKIMSSAKQGELYAKMLLNSRFKKQAMKDTDMYYRRTGLERSEDKTLNISRNISLQTATGKKFVKRAMKEGYEGLFDTHGTNVADNPLIVLNPKKNLVRSDEPTLTKPVKDFLDKYYGGINFAYA